MTRLTISPGACGFETVVDVRKKEGKVYSVRVTTECETVQKLGEAVAELDMMDCFKRFVDNPVYRAASSTLKHASCPVPSGILKTLEVEAGLSVRKDVTMKFEEKKPEETN